MNDKLNLNRKHSNFSFKNKLSSEPHSIRKLAIICGGTGGHFYPGLTIARKFNSIQDQQVCLYIGGHKVGNQKKEAAQFRISIKEVKSARISKHPIKLILFFCSLVKGFIQGRKFLKEFNPDAVLAMGSFTSIPISLAAINLKIPLFLHDGNAKVGRANIFLSKWAKCIMTAFPPENKNLLKCKHILTGMPLRPEISKCQLNKDEAIRKLNEEYNGCMDPNFQTILVFGGSQGAATINRVIPETIPLLNHKCIQIIHLTGKVDLDTIQKKYSENSINHLVLPYSDKMSWLYSAADLIICRSGGSTISELIFFKKPAILIPYPLASDLHQNANAEVYLQSGIAEIVENPECTKNRMQKIISKFLHTDNQTSELFSLPNEISNATDHILQLLNIK